jgi:hypothetical protein
MGFEFGKDHENATMTLKSNTFARLQFLRTSFLRITGC